MTKYVLDMLRAMPKEEAEQLVAWLHEDEDPIDRMMAHLIDSHQLIVDLGAGASLEPNRSNYKPNYLGGPAQGAEASPMGGLLWTNGEEA